MRWEKLFLALAAASNAVWGVLVAVAPQRLFDAVPPVSALLSLAIFAVGSLFAVTAVRPTRALLGLGLLAKALGPFVFLLAADRGYLRPSSWPLVLATDVVWIPPLLVLYRRRRR